MERLQERYTALIMSDCVQNDGNLLQCDKTKRLY